MDEGQRRVTGNKARLSGNQLKLLALLTVTLAAAGLFALEEDSPDPRGVMSELPGDACSAGHAADCSPARVYAPGRLTANPSTAGAAGASAGRSPSSAGHGALSGAGARPRELLDDELASRELRPGYTMAELCAAGLDRQPYRCQTGRYEGGFSASRSGAVAGSTSGYTISGRVLTVAGIGLAGVRIVAAPDRLMDKGNGDPGTLRFWTVTDSLGVYSLAGLPEGEYTIRSQAQGPYPSARLSARTGVDYADLVVSPSLSVVAAGRVVTEDGAGLEGVTVLPVLPGQPSVLTDDEGRFSLPVTVKPSIASFALRFQRPGYHEQTDRFDIARAGAATGGALRVVMAPVDAWTSVRGTVQSDSGEPLAGRTVELRPRAAPRSYRTTTDSQGRYEFPVVESPADYRLLVLGGAGHKDYQQNLHVTATMGALDVVAESYAYGEVTGQLVNLSGEPIPDFELVLRNAGSSQPNTLVSTDEDGNFEIDAAPAGRLVVASQSTPSIMVEGLELKPGERLNLPLVLDWGQHELRGMVVDARGNPVPASRILLQWSHESDGIMTRTTRRTAADTQGHFAFSELGPGPHSLKVSAPGFAEVVVNHDVSRQGYDTMVRLN